MITRRNVLSRAAVGAAAVAASIGVARVPALAASGGDPVLQRRRERRRNRKERRRERRRNHN